MAAKPVRLPPYHSLLYRCLQPKIQEAFTSPGLEEKQLSVPLRVCCPAIVTDHLAALAGRQVPCPLRAYSRVALMSGPLIP